MKRGAVAPIPSVILGVVLLILVLLLRAVTAPLVLIGTVVLSFGDAIGLSALVPGRPVGARHRLNLDFGGRMWWPSRLTRHDAPSAAVPPRTCAAGVSRAAYVLGALPPA